MLDELIKSKLSQSLLRTYERSNHLHDWYLRSVYIANTGSLLQTYSARGKSTLQLAFSTSGPEKDILLIYKNLSRLQVDFEDFGGASILSLTGFGRCLTSRFTLGENDGICHDLEFEDGTMHIACEDIKCRRVIYNYW